MNDILMKQRSHTFCLMVIFYVNADELQAPSQSRSFASYRMHLIASSKKRQSKKLTVLSSDKCVSKNHSQSLKLNKQAKLEG